MTINRIDGRNPSAPNDLTEEAVSTPVAPTNLTEQAVSEPLAPTNLTEQAKSDPAAPTNLTEIAASEPLAPSVVSGTAENLLRYSEQFDNAAWTKTAGITVTANSAIAPDGTLTADLIEIDTTNRILSQLATGLPIGVLCTSSVWIKGTLGETLKISAGGVEIVITLDGTFQRITNTQTSASTVFNINTFSSTTARSFLLWGAQVNRGGLAPYLPTTSAARTGTNPIAPSNLTEIAVSEPLAPTNLTEIADSTPLAPVNLTELADAGINRTLSTLFNFNAALGLPDSVTYSRSSSASYIETFEGRLGRYQTRLTNDYVGDVENLAFYSEDFDNAVWGKLDLTFIKKQNEFICLEGTSSSEHRLDQNDVAVSNSTYTLTAKAYKGNRGIAIRLGNNFTVTFDLVNGVIESSNTNVIASIKYVGDGFYDCSVFNAAPSNAIIRMNLSSNGSLSYQGDTVSGVILKKAQVTVSAKPLPYVRTFEAAVTQSFTASPRYEEKGLLVEGASTNYDSYSEGNGLHNVGSTFGVVTHPTATENTGITPEGSYSAVNASWTTASERFGTQSGATTQHIPDQTGDATISLYIKLISGDASNLSLTLRQTGTGGTRATRAIGSEITGVNGWVRIELSGTTVSGGGTCGWYLGNATTAVVIQVWAYQLEALPFATSYIRTEGSTVTRAKDDVIANVSLAGNQVSLFCSYSHNTTEIFSSRISYSFNDGGFNNRFIAILNSSNLVNFQASAGGALQYNLFASGAGVDGTKTFDTVLIANNGNVTTYLEREQINTASLNTFPPNLNTLQLGSNLYGHINRMEVYDVALTVNEVKKL